MERFLSTKDQVSNVRPDVPTSDMSTPLVSRPSLLPSTNRRTSTPDRGHRERRGRRNPPGTSRSSVNPRDTGDLRV